MAKFGVWEKWVQQESTDVSQAVQPSLSTVHQTGHLQAQYGQFA